MKRLQAAVKVIAVNSDVEQNLVNFLRLPESAEFMDLWTGFTGCVQDSASKPYRLGGLIGAMAVLIVTRPAFRALAVIFTQKLITSVNTSGSAPAEAESVARSHHYNRLLEYLHRAEKLEDAKRTMDAADLDNCDGISKEFLRMNDVENLLEAATRQKIPWRGPWACSKRPRR